jgi:hypothetical protein
VKTIKATLHHYAFESGQHPDYKEMIARIKANSDGRGSKMHCWGGDTKPDYSKADTSEVVEIETSYIFDNQANTADGRRIFDWYEEYRHDHRKNGHWIEIPTELAELRRTTLKCGYCGKQYGPQHDTIPGEFCTACLDSPYLKTSDLYLLRLRPISVADFRYPPLTEAEQAELMPRYIERQTIGKDSRAVQRREKQRANILAKYEKKITAETEERDGMLWLWNKGIDIENVIYYSHTRNFAFGWRSPVSSEVKSKLLDIISEFPFDYEIKAVDGTFSSK